jgi:hypothetical protein
MERRRGERLAGCLARALPFSTGPTVNQHLDQLRQQEGFAMAVLAIFTGNGFTKELYESLLTEVKWESNPAPGAMVHACGFDEAGVLHVADVWESVEEMNDFVGTRLMPGLVRLGIPAPSVSVFPLHNLNVFPAARKHQL